MAFSAHESATAPRLVTAVARKTQAGFLNNFLTRFSGGRYATGLLVKIRHNTMIKHTILSKLKIIQMYYKIVDLIIIESIIDRLKII